MIFSEGQTLGPAVLYRFDRLILWALSSLTIFVCRPFLVFAFPY